MLATITMSSPAGAEPEPVHGVRVEAGLGGPNGFGAVRYVRRLGEGATFEPAVGYGATGLGGGAIVALQLRKPGGLGEPLATRKLGWRLYAGASVARTLVEPETSIDVPAGTYVWVDVGVYWHARVGMRAELAFGINLGVIVASPDREMIGSGDDDFDVIGFVGAPSWWVKQGVAPGLWVGLQL